MQQITAWQASDGSLFTEQSECAAYEQTLAITATQKQVLALASQIAAATDPNVISNLLGQLAALLETQTDSLQSAITAVAAAGAASG